MRRLHLSLSVAVLFALAACMPAQPSATGSSATSTAASYLAPLAQDRPVTISFENYNLASAGIGREATLKKLDEFQQQHPNIKVEAKGTGSGDMFPSIQAQVAAGTPPDIAQLILREWDLNIENLPVKPLTDLIAPAEYEEHLKSAYPFHPRAVQLTERTGKQWGLSYVFSTPTLFYNADLFRAAGLDPNQPPRTWDEVKQAGKQIHERTGNGGLYIACIENDWCAQAILLSNGARIMSEDRSKVTFADPAAVEVFRFWQSTVQEGAHVKMSEAEGQEAFAAGKIGMYLNTSAVQGGLLKAATGKWELKATGMPAFGDKPIVSTNSGSALAILFEPTSKPEQSVVQVGLQMFLTQEGDAWGPLMAGATLACVPIFALYIVLQRHVIDAFVRSGLK